MAKTPKSLTPLEALIMDVVWDHGEVTVRQVQHALHPKRQLAYTSVLTMMQVLERKNVVRSRREGRANVYQATVSRTRFGLRSASDVVNSFFAGSVPAMVSHFADADSLSAEDLRQLEAIVSEATKRNHVR